MVTPMSQEAILSDTMDIINFSETGMSISGIAIEDGQSKSVIHRITTPNKKHHTPESRSCGHRLTTPSKKYNTPDSKSGVHKISSPYKHPSTPESEKKIGRPRVTTKRDDRMIVRTCIVDCKTPTQISNEFAENTGKIVSRQTVYRRLNEAGVKSRSPAAKSLINCENQKADLQYASEDDLCTPIQWEEVHLMTDDADEPEFNFLRFEDKKPMRRIIGKRLFPETIKTTIVFEGSRVVLCGIVSAFALAVWFVYLTR